MIENFLEEYKNFSLEELDLDIPHSKHDFGTYILPFNGFDGFFVAKLKKTTT